MKKTFMIAAFVLLGALLLWVSRYCYLKANSEARSPERGGIVMEKARIIHYAKGKQLVDIRAERSEISSDMGVIKSRNVKGRFAPGTGFTCGDLSYNSYEKTVFAKNKVNITSGEFRVSTGECRLLADNGLIIAPGRITVTSPRGRALAAGGIIDMNAGTIRLNKTQITIFAGR